MSVSAFGVDHGDDVVSKARGKMTVGQRVAEGLARAAERGGEGLRQTLRDRPDTPLTQLPRGIARGVADTSRRSNLWQGARKIRAESVRRGTGGTGVSRSQVSAAVRGMPRPNQNETVREWVKRGGVRAAGQHLRSTARGMAQSSGASGFAGAARDISVGDAVRAMTTRDTVVKPANVARGKTTRITENNPILGPRTETIREGGRFLKPKHSYNINGETKYINDQKGGLTGAGKAVAASPLAAGGLGAAEYSRRKRESIPPGM